VSGAVDGQGGRLADGATGSRRGRGGAGSPLPLREEIETLRELIAQVSSLAKGSNDVIEVSRALQAISQGADRLSHLLREQQQDQRAGETVEEALERALEELMQEMEIDEQEN